MAREDNWCWEHSFINLDVGAEDVNGIVFVQKGYWVNVISTHDVDAYMTQADASPMNLKIKVASLGQISPVEIHLSIEDDLCTFMQNCLLFLYSFVLTAERCPAYMCGIPWVA